MWEGKRSFAPSHPNNTRYLIFFMDMFWVVGRSEAPLPTTQNMYIKKVIYQVVARKVGARPRPPAPTFLATT